MNIETIESELSTGQIPPQRLAEMKDWLSAQSSRLMDRQLELQMYYAYFYNSVRTDHKSDKSVLMAWRAKDEGKEEMKLEVTQKKIKTLREAVSSHLRVHSDQARNMY